MSIATFWIERPDDENIKFTVGEHQIAHLCYDDHGFLGMKISEDMFRNIAKQIGAEVKEL